MPGRDDLRVSKNYVTDYISFNLIYLVLRWLFIRFYYGLINILTFNGVNISIIFRNIYNVIYCGDLALLFTVYS